MSEFLSRRSALQSLMTAGTALGVMAVIPAGPVAAAASDKAKAPAAPAMPHVTPQDPTAVALSYFEDSGKVDAKKFPTYKAGQQCSNCLQSKGAAGDAWLACNLFPGKMVAAKGWCKVYVKRP